MKISQITEAAIQPDQEFMSEFEDGVDEALSEYSDFLLDNNDVDNIKYLAELLNDNMDGELRTEFYVSDQPRANPGEWLAAEASAGFTDDDEFVKDLDIILFSKNLEGVYGPQTFKKMLMRLVAHETIHWQQYDKMSHDAIKKHATGHQKGTEKFKKSGKERDWMRTYLRDPHELMAYGQTLADEMLATGEAEAAIRNPESFGDMLPTYLKFRKIFPKDAKQMKQLLKYAANYI